MLRARMTLIKGSGVLETNPRASSGVLRVFNRPGDKPRGALREPLEDLGAHAVVETDLDRDDRIGAADGAGRDMDDGRPFVAPHRLARNEGHVLVVAHADLDRRGHARVDAAEDVDVDPD